MDNKDMFLHNKTIAVENKKNTCQDENRRIITLMYNKYSCKVCGTYLTSVSLCEVCEEQISWMCSKCDKMYDVTHAHNVLVLK